MALDIKKIEALFKKLTDPKAAGDFNAFVDKMPQNVGQNVLIAAGIVWAMAGALGLFTSMQAKALTELRADFKEAEALTPIVPKINDVPIDATEVKAFVDKVTESYKALSFQVTGSSIVITANSTVDFAKFREAIGHMQNGGSGWRVTLDKLCVGRECSDQQKLAIALKVNKVSVENPAPQQ